MSPGDLFTDLTRITAYALLTIHWKNLQTAIEILILLCKETVIGNEGQRNVKYLLTSQCSSHFLRLKLCRGNKSDSGQSESGHYRISAN